MTDNPEYAATYVKNGGGVVKVTIPKLTLEEMMLNGGLSTRQGIYVNPNDIIYSGSSYREYVFAPWIKPLIVNLFTPL